MFAFPEDNYSRDQVTPYRLSLLILIKEYADIFDGKNKDYPRIVWQDEMSGKRHLDRALLLWIQQPDGSLKDILRTVAFCSKVLYSAFTSVLDTICNFESIGNMENFFEGLSFTLCEEDDSVLHRRGLLGLFCRRMLVYYERLPFCELQPFFAKFLQYCSPHIVIKQPISAFMLRKASAGTDASDVTVANTIEKEVVDDMELESQSEMDSKSSRDSMDADLKPSDLKPHNKRCDDFEASEYFTRQQAEYFFSQQAALLEIKQSDALPPEALQTKIRQVLRNNPELAQAHYVSYLNNLRVKEFCGAMDSLYMYFVRHNKTVSSSSRKKLDDGNIGRTQRFATLNLALLHMHFGHKKAALAATKESIKLSQVSNDSLCLQHALSLLTHLEPKAKFYKIGDEVVKPAKKLNLTDLAFLALQTHTNHLSTSGERPCLVFRKLAGADALQCTRPFSYFSSTGFAHKASLWKMYGKRYMAALYSQLALGMQSAMDKKAHSFAARYNPEDIALSLCHLAEFLHEEGMNNAGNDLMNNAKIRFSPNSSYSHYWRKAEARLNHQLSLRLCKQHEAALAEQCLKSINQTEALYRKAENLATFNENLRAHSILTKILKSEELSAEKNFNPELKCQVYMLMANLLSRNKCERAASFKYILEAFSTAHNCYLEGLATDAMLKLAQLQFLSASPCLGLCCIKSFTLECMSHASLHMKSKLFLIYANCKIKNKTTSIEDLDTCINLLHLAQEGFEKCQDLTRKRDAVYLLAKLYHRKSETVDETSKANIKAHLECVVHRNNFASEFKRLDMQLGSRKQLMHL
ncbi:unnamed protein product [Clavelina lepadiformis]|uniref:Anaphase-promoting complex subunit 5 n=1 Tax=Clavelina lepadiformis TaxID=159417 RepID=A0ABP0F2E7_CLALP